jgi:uncharacterized repeat protein (TIGR01451 family)
MWHHGAQPRQTALDVDDSGFAAVWGGLPTGSPASMWIVETRRLDASGTPQGMQSWANVNVAERPRVSSRPDGAFVVVNGTGLGNEVTGRRFQGDGSPLALPFYVSSTARSSAAPDVHMDDAGDFVVMWETAQDGNFEGISGRKFEFAGTGGPEFRVNTSTTGHQNRPSIAGNGEGDMLVTWHSDHLGPWGLFAQRYAAHAADVAISITSSPTAIVRGTDFSYSMTVTNNGPDPALSVEVAFSTPPGLIFLANDGACTTPFPCALGPLAVGDTRSIVATFRMPPDYSGPNPVVATMTATSPVVDLQTNNNTATTQAMLAPDQADLRVWQNGPTETSAGWDLGYSITVANLGPSNAAMVHVENVTPAGLVFVSNGGSCTTPFPCDFGPLPAGISVVVGPTYFVPVDFSGPSPIVNHVVVSGTTADPTPGNNISDAFTTYVPPDLEPAALVVDAAGNGVFQPGETVSVVPHWRNAGTMPVINTVGAVASLSGPNATYVIADGAATYGTVGVGDTVSCGADCYRVHAHAASRPVTHWDATIVEQLTPSTSPRQWPLHIGDSFADVPATSAFYRFVETLLHRGVTGGCAATSYCPRGIVSREAMAVFVIVAKEGIGYVPPACTMPTFADVPVSSPYCRWIDDLVRRNVVGGCGGGNYCPHAAVTREQMALFTLRTLAPAAPAPCTVPSMFIDVPPTSPFCSWIEELARRGVVTGCGGGAYCPTAPVTREQMAVILTVTFGLTLYGP